MCIADPCYFSTVTVDPTLILAAAYPTGDFSRKREPVLILFILPYDALFYSALSDQCICPFIGFTADEWLVVFGSARLQREKEKLEKLLIAEKANLEEKIALFFKEFSNGALAFFSQSLVRRTSEFLKEVKVDDKGVVDLTAPTILELLRRGRCICGAEITEGNDVVSAVVVVVGSAVGASLCAVPDVCKLCHRAGLFAVELFEESRVDRSAVAVHSAVVYLDCFGDQCFVACHDVCEVSQALRCVSLCADVNVNSAAPCVVALCACLAKASDQLLQGFCNWSPLW